MTSQHSSQHSTKYPELTKSSAQSSTKASGSSGSAGTTGAGTTATGTTVEFIKIQVPAVVGKSKQSVQTGIVRRVVMLSPRQPGPDPGSIDLYLELAQPSDPSTGIDTNFTVLANGPVDADNQSPGNYLGSAEGPSGPFFVYSDTLTTS